YGLNQPSRMVGGDYFDCIPLSDGRVVLAVGDVSGKGLGAALLMSNLHAGLHTLLQSGLPMNEMINRLNDLIYRHTDFDKFITFFYAELDPQSRLLRYVNAGHNPPMLCRSDGGIELLTEGGLILGMLEDVDYMIGQVELRSGDLLTAYTDGVTDARNGADELFDEDRLAELVRSAARANLRADEVCMQIVKAVEDFSRDLPQADDITLLIVKVL
ncbi:MAG: serine/threonine-protein phosphatase, partial [candidate division KSB1 bacterium]|nr:serine/threonine-protein phosphatase [candidate division KSB1 bacterium]